MCRIPDKPMASLSTCHVELVVLDGSLVKLVYDVDIRNVVVLWVKLFGIFIRHTLTLLMLVCGTRKAAVVAPISCRRGN